MKGLISIVESLCFEKWGLKKKKGTPVSRPYFWSQVTLFIYIIH